MEKELNAPVVDKYLAEIVNDGMYDWVKCPFCGKRAFMVTPGAVIKGQIFKCRGSSCKKEFEVNYNLEQIQHPNNYYSF